jgi:hypothetical protein
MRESFRYAVWCGIIVGAALALLTITHRHALASRAKPVPTIAQVQSKPT